MVAHRTDKVGRQFLPLIFITAHPAAPHRMSGCSCGRRLRLDMLLIIAVGCRRHCTESLHLSDFAYKHRVRAQIDRLRHLHADKRVRALSHRERAVAYTTAACEILEFVSITSRLKPETLEQTEISLFAHYRHCQYARFAHHFTCQRAVVEAHRHLIWRVSHLLECV